MSIETYLKNSRSGNYHLGAMFYDCMKGKPPNEIFQIDAATGESETNASVLARSIRLARCFRQLGLKPGDVLSLGGKNHLDVHIPYYAALLNGYPVNGVDPYYKYDEIKVQFDITRPKIAFCQQENAEVYAQVAKDLGIDVKIVTFDGDCTLSKFMDEYGVEDNDNEEFQPAKFDTEKVYAWLVSTSGTTGVPKVAAFKHHLLIDQILGFARLFNNSKTDRPKICLNLAPVQWISAFYNAVAAPILNQIKLQTSNPDDLEHVIDLINKYKPTATMLSPSMMSSILKNEKYCDLTCFDLLTLSGSKIYKELALEVKKRLRPDAILMEAYGQTETIGPCLSPNPRGPIGNCGVPMPTAVREIKLVDPNTGEEVTEPNVPGELWTRGPSFAEYYNNPKETAKAFTEDGWYKTGDLLYRDENHNYFFVDRLKILIKYRNYHINPTELEEVLSQLPGVLDVCVVGIPHPEDSQHAVACVVRQPGCDVTAHQVKDIVAKTLSPSKQLRGGVVFLDSLPMTSTGKVARAKVTSLASTFIKNKNTIASF